MKQLEAVKDTHDRSVAISYQNSTYVYSTRLASNVATIIKVPATTLANSAAARFRGKNDFYVRFNATASIPTRPAAVGTGSIYKPDNIIGLDGVTKVTAISDVTCVLSVEFFGK